MLEALPSPTSGVNSVTRIMNSTTQHIRQCHSESRQAAKVSVADSIQSHGHRFRPPTDIPQRTRIHMGIRGPGATSSSSSGTSTRQSHPRGFYSAGSNPKFKQNFQQRKQKATADSERLHITFLVFRGCLRSLCN